MKITLDLPDETVCAALNYVFRSNFDFSLSLGVKMMDTSDLYDGAEIKVEPNLLQEDVEHG